MRSQAVPALLALLHAPDSAPAGQLAIAATGWTQTITVVARLCDGSEARPFWKAKFYANSHESQRMYIKHIGKDHKSSICPVQATTD
jgi:hypothetical protein